ncbi:MFS transporter [Roseomonas sp. CCTCC AB2023176]|uniref:MFS transporter n=1 Tax=Roseomonas sp. CCTCC AB2023176 TaxID=3342640 RepID=UPI0035DC3A5B
MPLPAALVPLRHSVFRMLWTANLVSNIGGWVQNTGAGWLMTSLSPSPLMVSLVQAASLLPVFLLALPAGALADLVDRRWFLIGAQAWICAMAVILSLLTAFGLLGPWGLLALTFAIGMGSAANFPAWSATTPEIVPRADLPQAIVLNGIGFNLARAVGPAIGGLLIAWVGTAATFAFNAVSFLYLIVALFLWNRPVQTQTMPGEGLVAAMRTGVRYVVNSPTMRGIVVRGTVAFFFAAAVWGLLPLLVRQRLHLGPEAFGLMLGCMGVGAVTAGFLLPYARSRLSRSNLVVVSGIVSGLSVTGLGLSTHWFPAGLSLLVYGATWISVASTLQAAAQLTARPWVRARAIGLYQVTTFGGLAAGSFLGGTLGNAAGIPVALTVFGLGGAACTWLVRGLRIELPPPGAAPADGQVEPRPADPAPELLPTLTARNDRVLEAVRYRVPNGQRAGFMAAMAEVRGVRLRAGALAWRLYADVARPDLYVELWAVESWTDHLREQARLSEGDHAALARAAAFHAGADGAGPEAARYVHLPL